jgi:hypothetical protein
MLISLDLRRFVQKANVLTPDFLSFETKKATAKAMDTYEKP